MRVSVSLQCASSVKLCVFTEDAVTVFRLTVKATMICLRSDNDTHVIQSWARRKRLLFVEQYHLA